MYKENIKKLFTTIIIILLACIIFLQRSCENNNIINPPITKVKTDTIWKIKHDTIIKTVKVFSTTHPFPPKGFNYQPTTNIDTCTTRFNKLLKDFITTRVYSDTLKIDSIGSVIITDTVFMNELSKRKYLQDIKIPFVTKIVTITKQEEPKKQLYIGANLFGNKTQLQLITPGLLYKSKKDYIYQVNLGINFDGSVTYGGGMYWKIKLK